MSFDNFNLNKEILKQVEKLGYQDPTPIQEQTIPIILEGKDLMGLAQTGTGKTAAFVLPILHRLIENTKRGLPRALIIAPTRELVEQINANINTFGRSSGIRSLTIYGGVSGYKQAMSLRRGVDIIVACPGRLLDHINQRTINLAQIETLVLDEADQMFDMGFLPSLKKIITYLPKQRQNLMFSATMPQAVNHLAEEILNNPSVIKINHEKSLKNISHIVFPVKKHLKTNLLIEILKETDSDSVLIFTKTKHKASHLHEKLQKNGYPTTSLQGNLSQAKRKTAIEGFRRGDYKIMVATDIAARGIDIAQISHVINYDTPDTPEAYIHRTGRTGRAMNKGIAFSLVTNEDKSFFSIIERKIGTELKSRLINNFNYNAKIENFDHEKSTNSNRRRFSNKRYARSY